MESPAEGLRRAERRSRFEIYLDILEAVERVRLRYGLAKPTRVQYQVNLPHDRFTKYLTDLRTLGMLELDSLSLTRKGHVFRTEAKRFLGILGMAGSPTLRERQTFTSL